jgi:mono/diheme cytochrome c family protein
MHPLNKRTALPVNLFLLAALMFAACASPEGQPAANSDMSEEAPAPAAEPAPSQDDALIAEGQTLYSGKAICFSCHGPDATGTQLAPNLTDDTWLNIEGEITSEKIINLIRQGVPQPVEYPAPMPPGGGANLTDAELDAVASYVLSLSM